MPTLAYRKGGILLANKEINEGVKATNNRNVCMCVHCHEKKNCIACCSFFLLLVQKVKMLMMESQKIEGSQQHITYAWRVFYQDERAQFLQVCYHTKQPLLKSSAGIVLVHRMNVVQ